MPDFSRAIHGTTFQNWENTQKWWKTCQNVRNIPNVHKIHRRFQIQGPQKYTKIGIFWYENICTIWRDLPSYINKSLHLIGPYILEVFGT
jgi:hypothetical protein